MVRLCAGVLPQMELGVFEGVARVMTAKELQAFKAALRLPIAVPICRRPSWRPAAKKRATTRLL